VRDRRRPAGRHASASSRRRGVAVTLLLGCTRLLAGVQLGRIPGHGSRGGLTLCAGSQRTGPTKRKNERRHGNELCGTCDSFRTGERTNPQYTLEAM